MCAVWGGGKLGLAFYLVETAHLHIMPDRAESEDFGLLKRGGSRQNSAVDDHAVPMKIFCTWKL